MMHDERQEVPFEVCMGKSGMGIAVSNKTLPTKVHTGNINLPKYYLELQRRLRVV
jgi:hypothetical protein